MSVFKELLSATGINKHTEVKSQGFFRDDKESFIIRPLKMNQSHFIDEKDGEAIGGYWHTFKNEYYFPGFKGVPAGYVTPGFPRDIVLTFHDVYEDDELPRIENGHLAGAAILEVGLATLHEANKEAKIAPQSNKIINTLIGVVIVLALACALKGVL